MNQPAPNFDLSSLDDAFATAKAPDNNVPAGRYQVAVDKVEIKTTKNGDPRLSWQLRILNGEHAGRFLFMGHMLCPADNPQKTADRMGYLKKDLAACGVTLTKLSELPAKLAELLDVKLSVRQAIKEDKGEVYTNVYIDKKLDPNSVVDQGASFPAGDTTAAQANELFNSDLPKI